jgi:coproporphyrinogen III oxidase-like Fe-S oxidoreductase
MSEFMMTGLRLTQEGVSEEEFQKRFGRSMHEVYEKEIDELLKLELIERVNNTPLPFVLSGGLSSRKAAYQNPKTKREEGVGTSIRLTRHGRLLGNQVFMRFI